MCYHYPVECDDEYFAQPGHAEYSHVEDHFEEWPTTFAKLWGCGLPGKPIRKLVQWSYLSGNVWKVFVWREP